MRYAPETEFILGECECPILEDDAFECVKNDREKLVENDLTRALLAWLREQVDKLAEEMTDKRRKEQKTRDLRQSSLFNTFLDHWKNRFMVKLTGELFGGSSIGDSFGGTGGGSATRIGGGGTNSSEDGGNSGEDEGKGGGAGDQVRKGPKFPRVLLSGVDSDPLNEDTTGPFEVDERQPPIYQRDIDITEGIYWINTARPLASKLMDECGAESTRWREYLFQRYVDIILKQSVYELAKRDADFAPYKVDNLIDDITSRVHDAAAEELEHFLFDEHMPNTIPPDSQNMAIDTITATDTKAATNESN
jgi:hypothetical protein